MATWSAGLLFGVAVLLANNPWKKLPRLRNRTLVKWLPIIPATAAVLGGVGGVIGYHGWMTHWQSDFVMMVDANIYRPYRFMATWGVHLGGYVGGLIGTMLVVAIIIRRRIKDRA